MDDREEKIRALAYALWQQDGEPDASASDYWFRAEDELRRLEAMPSAGFDQEMRHDASDRDAAHAGDKPTAAAAGDDLPMPD